MTFNPNARLDTSEVSDQRGGGMLGSVPGGGLTVGGGAIGIIVAIVALLFGANPFSGGSSLSGGLGQLQGQSTSGQAPNNTLAQECQTGQDANTKDDCRIVAYVDSVQKYWTDEFQQRGQSYTPVNTVFFSGQTQTGCGPASTEVGPFYCPVDKLVYIDLGFYDELRTRFGATGGPFAEAYVIAHEYGHHIQDLEGVLDKSRGTATGPQSAGVRTELQADCLAGMWAKGAVATGFITNLTDADIKDGLNAASSIGDDRIQKQAQGQVNPETFTHGTSEQRQRWFLNGYQATDQNGCDTFTPKTV